MFKKFIYLIFLNSILADIHYHINDITCINKPHKWDEYYSSTPCQMWKYNMEIRNPKNIIQCIESINGITNEKMHGCKPAFGGDNDYFKVSYNFIKNTENTENNIPKYTIIANASRHVYFHPYIVNTFYIILIIFIILIICFGSSNNSNDSFSDAYWGATFGNSINYKKDDNWSWTYE